ncbi:MAG TPA: hypothetical protein VGM20_02530 [Gemmatimonadales bacterium]|jgi:hypothetical protein
MNGLSTRVILLTGIAAILLAAPSRAQQPVHRTRHRRKPTDTTAVAAMPTAPPVAWPVTPVLPGAILPGSRIVAFYGNPLSTQMGVLGALPPAEMLAKLATTAKAWAAADAMHSVKPALQLIATVASGNRGPDGLYRIRHSDSLIAEVAGWAEQRNWLMILDVQVGWSSVSAELPRLIPWLKKPWVHLAIDPEFAMHDGRIPSKKMGTLDARDINYAIDFLAKIVDEEHLPPKVLVVHRWTQDMLTNYRQIKRDPRVQVIIDMDGNGPPSGKTKIYDLEVQRYPVQFTGFKLFYKLDHPMMTLAQVLALDPVPLYIQYQ